MFEKTPKVGNLVLKRPIFNKTEKMKIFKLCDKWKKIIWHCFPLSFKVQHWFWAFFDQPVLFYTILKNIRFVKFSHLQRFFDRPKSYFFSLNSSCATNFGLIFKIFVICTPPDLGSSNEYFGSLLCSSVLEELLRKSTWYFFLGRRKYILTKYWHWSNLVVIFAWEPLVKEV